MKIGVAYYPEQWPQDRWEKDARSMAQLGVEVVRIGEFAWSRLEPRRERIEMDWLGDVIDILSGEGLKIILCTPTAAPPPWLFSRHKSILPQCSDGRQLYYGSRRHVCINNPAYEKYVRRIVTELARRFGENPHIYAWQIDNELSSGPGGTCYCDECEQAFRMWLKRRYGTIDRLNKLWGAEFWSQSFVDWHEVPVPRDTTEAPHPSLLLDYRRFTSARVRAFAMRQKDIINEYSAVEIPVTVNEPWPGSLPHINTFSLAEVQDVVSVNNYPAHISKLAECIMGLDMARSLKRGPFWAMEQQAGAVPVNGEPVQPHPGQLRLWAYQAAGRGAELISFFRWRTAVTGQQMHLCGILNSDGMPGGRYDELKQTISELKRLHGLWRGRMPAARAGIWLDFESAWALSDAGPGSGPDYFSQQAIFHDLLHRRGMTADFVARSEDLSGYEVVIAPMPYIATSRTAEALELYVRRGGTLLVTAPAGWVSDVATKGAIRPPGTLAQLLGLEIKEHENLVFEANEVVFEDGNTCKATDLCCIPELRGASSLADYTRSYYAGSAALTVSRVDKGHALFLGTGMDASGLDTVLGKTLDIAGSVTVPRTAGEGVEVIDLAADSGETARLFILNHSAKPGSVEFAEGVRGKELFSGGDVEGRIELQAFQPALVELKL